MGKLDVVEVPYKGIPQAITDTMGGSLAFTFVDLGNALGAGEGRQARGLGVTSQKRTPARARLPAIAEELPGYELIAWFALVGAGEDAATRSCSGCTTRREGLAKPEIKEKFAASASTSAPMNPGRARRVHPEPRSRNWAKLVKLAEHPARIDMADRSPAFASSTSPRW